MPQGWMWRSTHIYVALKGITNEIFLHTYMNYSTLFIYMH